jgi:DNA invertase Pin-like site-specific DNA recombinase
MTNQAAGYVRVSTPIQAKEGESLSTQRQAIGKYCKSKEGLEYAC